MNEGRRRGSDDGATRTSRDQFIPVRKADLIEALIGHGPLAGADDRASFRRICRSLAAIYHYQYLDRLERLRHDYYYFNPDLDPHARFDHSTLDAAYADLATSFTAVLTDANFAELTHAEIEQAHRERKVMRVSVEANLDDFREVRFFRRGHHVETLEARTWFGLRRERHDVLVYDDVILFAAAKPTTSTRPPRRPHGARGIRPGAVLIKYFRNVAAKDLNALFPNVRVVMSLTDKLVLGVPAIAGVIPILMNLVSTISVLFLVIGFYLGFVAAIEHEHLRTAFAALTALAVLTGFVMRQWLRYRAQSLKYQKELTDNIYFRNVNNNSGIFDAMIADAEEQECKEAFLAYYFLRTAKVAPTQAELEQQIENWLAQTFGVEVDFKVDDALAGLARLDLLERTDERLAVPAPDQAMARLARVWDGFFPSAGEAPSAADTRAGS
jgi:hypothetical protein